MTERPHRHGFDVDDVLYPSAESVIARYNELHGTQLVLEQWYDVSDPGVWGTDDATERTHWVNAITHDPEFVEVLRPIEGAQEALEAQRARGDILSAITGRPSGDNVPLDLGPATRYMLQRDFPGIFPPDSIHFTSHFATNPAHRVSKLSLAQKLELNRFSEDLLDHANPIAAAAIQVFLFDKSWNQDGAHETVIRVTNWQEHAQAQTRVDREHTT